MIESTGVSALGIHGRLTEERPRHQNRNSTIKKLAEILTIPVIAKLVEIKLKMDICSINVRYSFCFTREH